MTTNNRKHNDNSPLPAQRSGEGPGVRAGIHRFPPTEHDPILEELAAHVDELITLTTGDHAPQKIAEFRSSFADITDPQHRAYVIESARRHYSTLLRHTKS